MYFICIDHLQYLQVLTGVGSQACACMHIYIAQCAWKCTHFSQNLRKKFDTRQVKKDLGPWPRGIFGALTTQNILEYIKYIVLYISISRFHSEPKKSTVNYYYGVLASKAMLSVEFFLISITVWDYGKNDAPATDHRQLVFKIFYEFLT